MNQRSSIVWFSIVGTVGVLFGIFYGLFGLEGLPAYSRFVAEDVFTRWSNGLYGSTFIGFSVLLFFIGRYAFTKKDSNLMQILLYGITSWLIVEALFSLYYGVYFNIGVDILLFLVLGWPLISGVKSTK